MTDNKKLQQLLHLLRLLNSPPAKDVPQLVRRMQSSDSSVYRHLKVLEVVGYEIETDEKNRKSLKFSFPKNGNGILNAGEINYLRETLKENHQSELYAQTILEKFHRSLTLIPLADALPQLHASRILQLIRAGIDSGHQLMLKNYRSLTSNTVENRHCAPLEITLDNRYLIAWDLKKDGQRQFKLERIEDVEILEEKIITSHFASPMDLFGLTGDAWYSVKLKLHPTAHHLLVEEFPLSRPFTRKVGEYAIFDGMVRNWKGVGRFVLGLPGMVEVIEPEEFEGYLEERRGQFGKIEWEK
jgi:predicted DNA-binding transcriptional regulator YafY